MSNDESAHTSPLIPLPSIRWSGEGVPKAFGIVLLAFSFRLHLIPARQARQIQFCSFSVLTGFCSPLSAAMTACPHHGRNKSADTLKCFASVRT